MSTQDSFEGQGGTLMGKAPAARIFALVVLSLVVLLGSLLAVRAIGQHDGTTPSSQRSVAAQTRTDESGVLVVPKDAPKPKPKPDPKPAREAQTAHQAPVISSAASTSAPVQSTSAPTPVQSAPAPTPTPAPTPKPAAPAAKKAPVQHTVVVTE